MLAAELAVAFVAAPRWRAEDLAEAGASCLDRWPEWINALAHRVAATDRVTPARAGAALVELIAEFLASHADAEPAPRIIRLTRPLPARLREPRVTLRHDWPIAEIVSVAVLAETLELSSGQLAWLADVRGLERTVSAERLRNYRYRAVPRASGLPRLIEAPKLRLKEVQRFILRAILDHVPAHPAAYGFAPGRSVVGHAGRHTGADVVVRLDLRDFFASVAAARVFGVFRTLGYPPAVARVLTGLCTNVIAEHAWRERFSAAVAPELVGPRFDLGRRLATPHLPQGAPTSPALANLVAFGLDRRLHSLAATTGLVYSRYADDLVFSGTQWSVGRGDRLAALVGRIAADEGFAVNRAKTVVRGAAARQQVCGIVVNARPNVNRAEYDRLKATLHKFDRNSADVTLEQLARLRGQIAWVTQLNPARGAKLLDRFQRLTAPRR